VARIWVEKGNRTLAAKVLQVSHRDVISLAQAKRLLIDYNVNLVTFTTGRKKFLQVWVGKQGGPWQLLHLPFDLDSETLRELEARFTDGRSKCPTTLPTTLQPSQWMMCDGSNYLEEA
jgi:hypothetical protein